MNQSSRRASGLLLHVTSLPGPFGIGDLGPEAAGFVAELAASGQTYWQVLPIGPTGYGNSPYQLLSTFAGNPLLLSLQRLADLGLVNGKELATARILEGGEVDFGNVLAAKTPLLAEAAHGFRTTADADLRRRFDDFVSTQGEAWLNDYSLFSALKEAHGGRAWAEWDRHLALREPAAIRKARAELRAEIEVIEVLQFLFFEQWQELKSEANSMGIAIVGDIPLYVAHDSADVWADPVEFRLDRDGQPTVVAGVPPDYFSETGQLWGNPIYDWEGMAESGFSWWKQRIRHSLQLFDVLRIDHFRGIAGFWEIPVGAPTAATGSWRKGPGHALFAALTDDLGKLPIVAEDLGVLTPDVDALRDDFGFPGMRVAQFGWDVTSDATMHHPANYPENVWAYTGTHDNDTTVGWLWQDNPARDPRRLPAAKRALFDATGGDVAWGLMQIVAESAASTTVFPVQDLLSLGDEARMNTPGTASGNWGWRLTEGQLTTAAMERLLHLTIVTDRLRP